MKVERSEGYCYFDYKSTDNDKKLDIGFYGNGDLYFSLIGNSSILEDNFIITKENCYIYECFDDLYDNIKNCDFGDESFNDDVKGRGAYKELFQDGVVVFESDDPLDYDMNFNVLKIFKEEDKYRLNFIFHNSKNRNHSIRIRNARSKYDPFNFVFMEFFNSLQEYDPEYHQMYIEEYVYKKKLRG